ncbi:hypothetical protein K438DRAFT_1801951 [Mycena galopus ATCC 62051]|nr:hypothetical protein K438DRAFT_1801951 [Mycena galopus ATCC 62051]
MLHIIIPRSSTLGLVASNQPLARDSLRAPSPSANVFVPLVLSKPKTSKCSECGARTHRHCPNRRCRQHCLEDGKPCLVHTPDSPAPMPSTHTNIDDTLALLGPLLQQLIDNSTAKIAQRQHRESRRSQEDDAFALALRTPLPTTPTSSQEEANRLLAIRLAYGTSPSPSPSPPPRILCSPRLVTSLSRTTVSSSSSTTSRLRSLSPLHTTYPSTHLLSIYFWGTNGSHAITFTVSDRPRWQQSWSNLQLSDILHLLALTTTPPTDNFYECFSPKLQEWVEVSVVDSVPIDTVANTLLVR